MQINLAMALSLALISKLKINLKNVKNVLSPLGRFEKIEIIKGSGTILYGPQTMGGVINYFTRRPRNDFGGILKLTGGENGYGSFFAEIGGWGNNKLKPELQLLIKRGDGFRQNNSFEVHWIRNNMFITVGELTSL